MALRGNMKDSFKVTNKDKGDYDPKEGKKSPWNFEQPKYDERSSCFVNAGTYHGVGINQPVGSKENKNTEVFPKCFDKNIKPKNYEYD